jgi:hypothetical protein
MTKFLGFLPQIKKDFFWFGFPPSRKRRRFGLWFFARRFSQIFKGFFVLGFCLRGKDVGMEKTVFGLWFFATD